MKEKRIEISLSALLTMSALVAVFPCHAEAAPIGYVFTPVAFLGDPAPGIAGGTFVNDFEPGGLNNKGDIAFGADVSTGGEGVFLKRNRRLIAELGRSNAEAPGGGTFDFSFLGPVGLNDRGDVVFNFLLQPFGAPFGVNGGAYRYSHVTGEVTPVVVPFATPAPDGGTFQGVSFQPTIDDRGADVFAGIIETDAGVEDTGLGVGIFRASASGLIANVVVPGDPAPGGGTFDYAVEPWVNDWRDVSFIGHIAGEESTIPGFPPQSEFISALGGLYVKNAVTGRIRTIVHANETAAPGGGTFRQVFHDVMNNRGEIAFNGDLTPAPAANEKIGVFLYSCGRIIAVARPGDPLPGGGTLVNASLINGNVHLNNRGEVAFGGVVNSDVDQDGNDDTGLFVWSKGKLSLVARTGTNIPGVGTVDELASPQLIFPPAPIANTTSGAINNDRGQIAFQVTLTDGRGAFLLATPSH